MSTNLIAENIYQVKCVRAEAGESAVKGTPYVRVTLELQDDGAFKGRRLSKDLWFSDKTWEKSLEAMRALGHQGEDVTALEGMVASGTVAVAKVVHEMAKNKDDSIKVDEEGHAIYYNEVAWIGVPRAGLAPPKAMEAGKLSSFRELMKARIQQLGGAGANGGNPKPGASKDEIPF